jgi:hypothetical protein
MNRIATSFLTALTCACRASDGASGPSEAAIPERAQAPDVPLVLTTQEDVSRAIQSTPCLVEAVLEHREIRGLPGQFQWHVGDTRWWVRLHGSPAADLSTLDRAKAYRATGYAMEQNYGVVEIWLTSLGAVE